MLKASVAILGRFLGGVAIAFVKEGREPSTCLELKSLYHDRDTIWSATCSFHSETVTEETTENESNVFRGTDKDVQDFSSLFWVQQTATSRYRCCWYISQLPSILKVLSCWKLHADESYSKGSPLLPHVEAPTGFVFFLNSSQTHLILNNENYACYPFCLKWALKVYMKRSRCISTDAKWRGWNTLCCLLDTECLERGTNVYSRLSVQGYCRSLARALWVESDPNHLLPWSLLLRHAFGSSSLFQQWRREEFSKQILRHCSFWALLNLQNKTVLNPPGKKTM